MDIIKIICYFRGHHWKRYGKNRTCKRCKTWEGSIREIVEGRMQEAQENWQRELARLGGFIE